MTAGLHATHAMSIAHFERFFREAASLDVDKDDLKRFEEFLSHNIQDLLIRATAIAHASLRQAIAVIDLPITVGLQERIFEFRRMDADIGLRRLGEEDVRDMHAKGAFDFFHLEVIRRA